MVKPASHMNRRTSDAAPLRARKAQASTEYLVIIAVVLVVALLVVSLIGGFSSFGAGSSADQQNAYWASLTPVGVSAAQAQAYYIWYHGSASGYPADDYDAVNITITNNGLYPLTISAASATAASTSFVWSGAIALGPGQVVTLPVHTPGSDQTGIICGSGTASPSVPFSSISFTYTQQGSLTNVERPTATLTAPCLGIH
jgi:hypothetical protein